jgi:hypothetical protein
VKIKKSIATLESIVKLTLWVGGFAKVDDSFGYEKWLQGGSAVLALL